MRDDCVSLGNIEGNNIFSLSTGTVVYVNVVGLQPMFTIYTGEGGRPGTGENTTAACAAYAGAATRTGLDTNEAD